MATEIVGHGIGFPLGIGVQGGFSLTKEQSELEQAIIDLAAKQNLLNILQQNGQS